MTQYIDKDALVAEIENLQDEAKIHPSDFDCGRLSICKELMNFIDTLEVEEVDLDEEIEKCMKRHNMLAVGKKDFTDIAKHFFELGLKASNPITAADKLKAQKGE